MTRRHDVDTGDVRHLSQLGDEIETDVAAFGGGIARAFQAIDDRSGNDGAE